MIISSVVQKSQLEGAHRLDAEYFQPEYLGLEKSLLKTNYYTVWGNLKGKFITGPFGSEFNVENYSENTEYRYVRGKDVKQFLLLDDDNVYIPEKDYERMQKYSLQNGDILISVVGTLGNSAIVNDKNLPAIFSCKSTLFRTDKLNPYYLIAYLNSKYGQNLLLRNARGQVQAGLNISDLKTLLIFTPSTENQKNIASIVIESNKLIDESKQFYSLAENLLLEELGLKNFQPGNDLSFVVNLSDVQSARRADAEFFQPKYEKLILKIKTTTAKLLPEVIDDIAVKFNPQSRPDETFHYVELANVNLSTGVIDGSSEILGKEAPSRAKRLLKTGDVIASSVEGSLRKVALVSEEQNDYLASTGFFQFRSKLILPEVLLVLGKSIVLQIQLEKQCTGTILTAVPQDSLKNILIPILPIETQRKIAGLVHQSHDARRKSKALLEQAKKEVEEMIEKTT